MHSTGTGRLFDAWVVSGARGARRGSGVSLPVSLALHGVGVTVLLAVPALVPLELPPDPPSGPVVFRLPAPVRVVHAAARPLPARSTGATRSAPTAPRPASQAAPVALPDVLPAADDSGAFAAFDEPLQLGPGCDGPGCIAGLPGPAGAGAGGSDGMPGSPGGGAHTLVAGRDVSPPVKLHDVRPDYPELARRIRLSGVVELACTIAPDGHVADARVVSGPALLDAAALAAVRQWRYRPTRVDGVPVAVALLVTVHFRLGR